MMHMAMSGAHSNLSLPPSRSIVAVNATAPGLLPPLGACPVLQIPSLRVFGWALLLAALAWTLVAQAQMGDSWRIGIDSANSTALVTSGLFAISRNPIFLAMRINLLGLFAGPAQRIDSLDPDCRRNADAGPGSPRRNPPRRSARGAVRAVPETGASLALMSATAGLDAHGEQAGAARVARGLVAAAIGGMLIAGLRPVRPFRGRSCTSRVPWRSR